MLKVCLVGWRCLSEVVVAAAVILNMYFIVRVCLDCRHLLTNSADTITGNTTHHSCGHSVRLDNEKQHASYRRRPQRVAPHLLNDSTTAVLDFERREHPLATSCHQWANLGQGRSSPHSPVDERERAEHIAHYKDTHQGTLQRKSKTRRIKKPDEHTIIRPTSTTSHPQARPKTAPRAHEQPSSLHLPPHHLQSSQPAT